MATKEIDQLKALTDGAVGYTDVQLQEFITTEGGVKQAATYIWRSKAASYSTLVNVSESGSSRALGDLQKQALLMADTLIKDKQTETSFKKTRRAVRR